MINMQLIKVVFTGAVLVMSTAVSAQDYPAADFQPKIVYRDPSIVEASKTSAANDINPPCAQKQEAPEVDAKYPAANFHPKVLYSATGS